MNSNFKSPNFDERSSEINSVILHYTELSSSKEAINVMLDRKVSAHYLIDRSGEVFSLVDVNKRAWHAGESCWNGVHSVNDSSIGIEIDNDGNEEFTDHAMAAVIELLRKLKQEFKIKTPMFLAHSDVAPLRKIDPGVKFNWKLLAQNGFGIMPNESLLQENLCNETVSDEMVKNSLVKFGYCKEYVDLDLKKVMKAFKMHYVLKDVKNWTKQDQKILESLIARKFN